MWAALTSGYDLEHLSGRYCLNGVGGHDYYYYAMNRVFGGLCQITGSPCIRLDVPQAGDGGPFVNFMKVGNSVMRGGPALVRLGIARAGRAQVNVYDVAGRKVRTLADRVFAPGEQTLQWDGTNDTGGKVARGIYFIRSTTDPAPGRIIVLTP
jgi:hypothetical protein